MDYERGYKKRGCLQSPSPKVRLSSPSSFYPYREYLALPWKVNLPVSVMEERAKDKPAASFILRNKIFHIQIGIRLWHATSEPVAELQQKTQSAGLWDKSLAQTGRILLLQGLYPKCYGLSYFALQI